MDITQAKKWCEENRKDPEVGNDIVRLQIYALNGLNRVVARIWNEAPEKMPFAELEAIYERRLIAEVK